MQHLILCFACFSSPLFSPGGKQSNSHSLPPVRNALHMLRFRPTASPRPPDACFPAFLSLFRCRQTTCAQHGQGVLKSAARVKPSVSLSSCQMGFPSEDPYLTAWPVFFGGIGTLHSSNPGIQHGPNSFCGQPGLCLHVCGISSVCGVFRDLEYTEAGMKIKTTIGRVPHKGTMAH